MNRRVLVATLFFLLLAPALIGDDLSSESVHARGPGSNVSPSSLLTLAPTSQTQLSAGRAPRVGAVNVRSLPESGPSSDSQNTLPYMHAQGSQAFDQGKIEVAQAGYVPPGESAKIVTTAPTASQALSVNVSLVLEGAPGGLPNSCACSPPDPNNGVGPDHVLEMVNTAGIIYAKNGTLVKSTFPLAGFFNVSGSLSDPQIFYDATSGRWFATIIDIPNNRIQIAVSTSNNPTSTFNLYSVSAGTSLPDQPTIGANSDKFVISANEFNPATRRFIGVQYWILNKSELVAGTSTVDFSTNNPDSSIFSLHPARHLTSTAVFYLTTDCIGSCLSDSLTTTNVVELVALSGVPPGMVTVTSQTLAIATSISPPNARQPGTKTLLVTNDNRILSAVGESNTLWLSWADACIPSGDTTTRSCVRLVQAATSQNGTVAKVQDFDFASKGEYLYYPALTLYQGELALVYGKSSSLLYPSLFVTGRLPSDPANSLQTAALIKTGTAPDLSGRYGDYFGAATDPSPSPSSVFWVSGEYRASSTFQNWNTAIARVAAFGPDFTISANPSNMTLLAGEKGNSTVSVVGIKFTGNVNLNVSISPAGLSCILNPSILTVSTSASSNLSCAGSAGSYNVTVTGSSGPLFHSVRLNVQVVDFTISTSPSLVVVLAGQSGNSNITITALNHFGGNVTLTAAAPPGLALNISPTRVAGSGFAGLTVRSSFAGNYTAKITGISGSLTHSVNLTVMVKDFTVTTNPNSLNVSRGTSTTLTITTVGLNGFAGSVLFVVSASPGGLPMSPTSTTVTLSAGGTASFNITFSPTSSTPAEPYAVNVTGSSGTLSHSVLISVSVLPSPGVGGVIVGVDKLRLLLPYIEPALTVSLLALAVVVLTLRARSDEAESA